MVAGGPAQLRSRPTGPCPCPSLSPSPSPPAAARAAAAASVEEPRDSPEAAARSPRAFPAWIRSRRRSPATDDGRPAASGRAAVQPPQAASPAASSGGHARCLPLPDPVRSRGDRASLPRRERRRATDARRRTMGDGSGRSTENFSSLPAWIRTSDAPSDLENFGGLRAAFIWPPFLQAVGIDHRL